MGLYRQLYVSRSRIQAANEGDAIERILAASRLHNEQHDVSGALVFSGTHFVQLLEGEQTSVEATFARIVEDPRHADIDVIAARPTAVRLFAGWSMAYRGRTRYVQGHIERLMHDRDAFSIRAFERLMQEFARVGGVEAPGVPQAASLPSGPTVNDQRPAFG